MDRRNYIASVLYPHGMVVRAVTDGVRLVAVLQPGTDGGTFEVWLGQLTPGRVYRIAGATTD